MLLSRLPDSGANAALFWNITDIFSCFCFSPFFFSKSCTHSDLILRLTAGRRGKPPHGHAIMYINALFYVILTIWANQLSCSSNQAEETSPWEWASCEETLHGEEQTASWFRDQKVSAGLSGTCMQLPWGVVEWEQLPKISKWMCVWACWISSAVPVKQSLV